MSLQGVQSVASGGRGVLWLAVEIKNEQSVILDDFHLFVLVFMLTFVSTCFVSNTNKSSFSSFPPLLIERVFYGGGQAATAWAQLQWAKTSAVSKLADHEEILSECHKNVSRVYKLLIVSLRLQIIPMLEIASTSFRHPACFVFYFGLFGVSTHFPLRQRD